jgi:hypothetical protein
MDFVAGVAGPSANADEPAGADARGVKVAASQGLRVDDPAARLRARSRRSLRRRPAAAGADTLAGEAPCAC